MRGFICFNISTLAGVVSDSWWKLVFGVAHDRLMTTGAARTIPTLDGQIAETARYQFAVVLSAGRTSG
jgi:hypothetical protein